MSRFVSFVCFAALWAGHAAAQNADAVRTPAPAVTEVLSVQERMNEATLNGDGTFFAEVLSEDFVASDPSNRIRRRDDMIAVFSSGQVIYDSVDATVDFAEQLGEDLVVVMGTESTTQSAVPDDSGLDAARTLRRRYTNVFRREGGAWRLLVKQSTLLSAE